MEPISTSLTYRSDENFKIYDSFVKAIEQGLMTQHKILKENDSSVNDII